MIFPLLLDSIILICSRKSDLSVLSQAIGEDAFEHLEEVTEHHDRLCQSNSPILVYPADSQMITRLNQRFPARSILCASTRQPRITAKTDCLFFRLPKDGAFLAHHLNLHLTLMLLQKQNKVIREQLHNLRNEPGIKLPSLNLKDSRTILIKKALVASKGQKSKAANLLGITRQALNQDLKRNELHMHAIAQQFHSQLPELHP